MGAWGMGVFDDDTSCEVIEDAMDESVPVSELVKKALSSSQEEYIEYTECHEIIVAAAMANALINKVTYDGVENLDNWLSKQTVESIIPFKEKLANALSRVFSESSELNELWAENEDDYPVWKGNLESIVLGLNS